MANLTATRVDDAGLTDLIQRMARDCPPDQFVREFIKNSIEAVQRVPGTDKQIRIDVDWGYFEATGVHKICFMDNGDGMTGNEMLKHLNNLSSSGHIQHDNYGVGAKISALTRNHAGIDMSLEDGLVAHSDMTPMSICMVSSRFLPKTRGTTIYLYPQITPINRK